MLESEDCHHERSEGSAVRSGSRSGPPAEAGSCTNHAAFPALKRWASLFRPDGTGFPPFELQRRARLLCVAFVCCLSSFAVAQSITGTVTNGTTGKPAAGDEVSLLSLSQGMQEIGTTKTDAQGKFSFPAPTDTQAPHMVRVTHQGVSYFPQGGPLMPGSTTAELTIYDAAPKVDGLSQTVEVDRLQSDGKQLQGIALYAVTNKSQPPRTVANDKGSFEIVLPDGAAIESAEAKGPGGQPIATETTPGSQKNHYLLSYPLRPGETQFQIAYHMPYSGEASFSPKALRDVQHFVVMVPKGMTFEAKDKQQFQPMSDPQSIIMVATNVKPGQDLSFRVGGSGIFQPDNQQAGQGSPDSGGAMGGGSQAAAADNRPGGGLGAPIDAPDPLHDYRAYILGAFALVLVMGGAYIVSRSNRPHPAAAAAGTAAQVEGDSADSAAAFADFVEPTAPAKDRNALLLEAMKEELFQLELDRQQEKVTAEEYTKAKAALDETLKRALARSKAGS